MAMSTTFLSGPAEQLRARVVGIAHGRRGRGAVGGAGIAWPGDLAVTSAHVGTGAHALIARPAGRRTGPGDRGGGDGRVRCRTRGSGAGRRASARGAYVKLRVHLDVADGIARRRLAALIKADPEIVLVAVADEADLVVSER